MTTMTTTPTPTTSTARELLPPDHLPHAEPVCLPQQGRPWTVDDLLRLADDPYRYELVRGDLMMMSPASPVQGRYAERLSRVLGQFAEDHALGEVYVSEPGFLLQPEPEPVIRAPDVAFVSHERIPPPDEQAGFWPLAPDLAVEIISPTETAAGVQEKVRDYLIAGARLVWLVYPRTQTVVEYRQSGAMHQYSLDSLEDTLEGGEVLPGFQYPLKLLFRERTRSAE